MTPGPERVTFAVIFDLDGLLVDTEPLWSRSAVEVLARRGRSYDASLKGQLMGRHPLEVARIMVAHYALTDDPAALLAERLEVVRDLYSAGVPLMPGAEALVHALAAEGVPIAVASGSPGTLLGEVLEATGLAPFFGVRVGSDAVQRGKPAPDLFLLAARGLGAEPASCVVLEDSPAGVRAALAAGMACVAVPAPECLPEDVSGAHLVVPTLEALRPTDLRHLVPPPAKDSSPRG